MSLRARLLAVGGVVACVLGVIAWYVASRPRGGVAPVAIETSSVPAPIAQQLDDIVGNFRRIIVLTENDDSLDEALRGRVLTVGRMLFEQNMVRVNALSGTLASELSGSAFPQTEAFLDRLENN
ncbi:MAG TPA: hypothetical protein VKG84_12215, partial [Candidatus Acidoferrales bacterium]|nr:hypothetical protein [Candidatus Acidoferrales bacterium]